MTIQTTEILGIVGRNGELAMLERYRTYGDLPINPPESDDALDITDDERADRDYRIEERRRRDMEDDK